MWYKTDNMSRKVATKANLTKLQKKAHRNFVFPIMLKPDFSVKLQPDTQEADKLHTTAQCT